MRLVTIDSTQNQFVPPPHPPHKKTKKHPDSRAIVEWVECVPGTLELSPVDTGSRTTVRTGVCERCTDTFLAEKPLFSAQERPESRTGLTTDSNGIWILDPQPI